MVITSHTQAELKFPTGEAPRISPDDVAQLCLLLGGKDWQTAAQLAAAARELDSACTWEERRIRAIAEASDGAVLSWPGSRGYKLFDQATEAEIAHCDAAWGSQIERMTARRAAYRRRHHRHELVSNQTTDRL